MRYDVSRFFFAGNLWDSVLCASFNSFANFSLCNVQRWLTAPLLRSNIIFGNRVSDSRFAQTLRKWNMPIKPSLLSINATTRAYNYSSNIGTLLDSVNNRTKSSFALLRMIPPIWESHALVFQYFEIVKIYLEFFFNQECIEIFFFCVSKQRINFAFPLFNF